MGKGIKRKNINTCRNRILKNEHLTNDARPIIACIGTDKNEFKTGNEEIDAAFDEMIQNAEDVNFFETNSAKLKEAGVLSQGKKLM